MQYLKKCIFPLWNPLQKRCVDFIITFHPSLALIKSSERPHQSWLFNLQIIKESFKKKVILITLGPEKLFLGY